MAGIFASSIEGGETVERLAARRAEEAKAQEVRRAEIQENRRRASTAKTLTASRRGGSLFPSDFAPSTSSSLG